MSAPQPLFLSLSTYDLHRVTTVATSRLRSAALDHVGHARTAAAPPPPPPLSSSVRSSSGFYPAAIDLGSRRRVCHRLCVARVWATWPGRSIPRARTHTAAQLSLSLSRRTDDDDDGVGGARGHCSRSLTPKDRRCRRRCCRRAKLGGWEAQKLVARGHSPPARRLARKLRSRTETVDRRPLSPRNVSGLGRRDSLMPWGEGTERSAGEGKGCRPQLIAAGEGRQKSRDDQHPRQGRTQDFLKGGGKFFPCIVASTVRKINFT